MRRFYLLRDEEWVAECILFSSGAVAVSWRGKPSWNVVLYSDIKYVPDTIKWVDID